MSHFINSQSVLEANDDTILLDVRSPVEYKKGHIPSAISLPLFSDEERKSIGILYKNEGAQAAFYKGLEFVGPKMRTIVERVWSLSENRKKIVIYCARGGKRSESVHWLLQQSGLQNVFRLKGGYQQFRNYVMELMQQKYPTIVLSGLTGVGKTKILHVLHRIGRQCIDLEEIACHRGSAFGGYPNLEQPTQQLFENSLALHLSSHRYSKDVVFMEDESKSIGKCYFPPLFFSQNIKEASVIHLTCSIEQRISNLLEEYGTVQQHDLLASLYKIERRLGREKVKKISHCIQRDDLYSAIRYILDYYDHKYTYNQSKRHVAFQMDITGMRNDEVAEEINRRMES